jgi:Pyruvate/2-oxoacid:ferredoxin oxidoreductase gamma subunit
MKSPFNIFITGVGGQGVITLANVLRHICELNDLHTTGAVIKGGAQRLGTVSASLRIFEHSCSEYRDFSLDIPDGSLDLMIGLEPWECLRARHLFSKDTTVLVNRDSVPLLQARHQSNGVGDPVTQLERLGVTLIAEEFTRKTMQSHGDKKMLNFEMGRQAVHHGIPAFSDEQFEQCFRESTGNAPDKKEITQRPG